MKNKEGIKDGGEKSVLDGCLEILEAVFTAVFAVLLIFAFLLRPVTVEGSSMHPTLEDGDKLIMETFLYAPKQGDIVIIDAHDSHNYENGTNRLVSGFGLGRRIVKRVIAVGGQTVDIDFETGAVSVDGRVLDEKYTAESTNYDAGAFRYPVTVPKGYVFVMGDNRNNSTDSRAPQVGFVDEKDIIGKAVLRFKFDLLG